MTARVSLRAIVALVLTGAACLAAGACKKSGPEGGPAAGGGEPGALEKAGFASSPSALGDVAALAGLPKDTLVVAVASNPVALIDALGRARLLEKYRQYYEQGVAAVTAAAGHNLLDPAQLPNIGVDPAKPFGVAWLDVEKETGAFFFGLTDAEKLKTWLYGMAGRHHEELGTEVVGDALIIFPKGDEETCLVLRGSLGFFVFTDRNDEYALEAARQLATLAAEGSLARSPAFTAAAKALEYGKDAAVFVNLPVLVQKGLAAADASRAEDDYYTRELAAAKERGAPADEIARLEQARLESEKWEQEARKRQQAERQLLADLTEPVGALAFGVALGEQSLKVKGIAALPAESLLGRVLKTGSGTPAIVSALGEPPLYLAHADVDVAAYRELVLKLLATEGDDLDELAKDLAEHTGIQLEADVLANVDGRFGFAATGRLPDTLEDEETLFAAVGGALVIGVKDAAKATALLERLAAMPFAAPIVKRDTASKRWRIDVPEWKPVHVGVTKDAIVASTDPGFLDRAEKGETGPWLKEQATPELRALFGIEGTSAVWLMDGSSLGFLFLGLSRHDWDYEPPPLARDPNEPPPSAAYQQKEKELEALRKEAKDLRKQVNDAENRNLMALVRLIGPTVAVARREGGHLAVYGGQYLNAASVPAFVEQAVDTAVAEETTIAELRRKSYALDDRRYQLQAELERIRAEDLKRHLEEQIRAQEPPAVAPVPVGP